MIEVYKTERVPENCTTCLYQSNTLGRLCCNANVSNGEALRYMYLGGCPHYWLNQHKYRRV